MNNPAPRSHAVVAQAWWGRLQPGPDGKGGNRGALARLRRVGRARDALLEREAIQLCRALPTVAFDVVAITAAVLAHVRADTPGSVAQRLGTGNGGAPVMSFLRFQRLIQADTEDERLNAFRRAVALADRKVSVLDLADSLLDWTDQRRQGWLYSFFDEPTSAPLTEDQAA